MATNVYIINDITFFKRIYYMLILEEMLEIVVINLALVLRSPYKVGVLVDLVLLLVKV